MDVGVHDGAGHQLSGRNHLTTTSSQARRDARIVAAAPRLLEFVRRAAERQDPGAAALLTSLGVPVGLTSDYRGDFESADDGP